MHYRDAVKTNKGPTSTILQICVLRTIVLVLRDTLFHRFVAFERLWALQYRSRRYMGKAVESESPSQAMALS